LKQRERKRGRERERLDQGVLKVEEDGGTGASNFRWCWSGSREYGSSLFGLEFIAVVKYQGLESNHTAEHGC